ncbi:MAG TPA: plastocyanin/azurin family copper-binding protein [Vicinamibacterales bacterium]|jgi:plastocyanin|nr:plastocyanin/azurin family copper-binding protein [Vicinamibacterales bacterium]
MLRVRVGFVAVVSMFVVGCSGSSYPSSPTPGPTPAPPGTGSGSSTSISIPSGAATLGSNAFNPNPLTVSTGTTVAWMNTDSIAHTSTSDASGWNSGTLAPGQQFTFTFAAAGTFHYHCAIHPGMIGTVVVH